jgi:hypothetical protein
LFGSAVHGEDFFFFLSSPFLSESLFFLSYLVLRFEDSVGLR